MTAARAGHKAAVATHVDVQNGIVTGLYCKGCGTKIAGMVVDGARSHVERLSGRSVVFQTLIFMHFNNYREVLIEFDDDSRHVTHLCAVCVDSVAPADLELYYALDIEQWASEGAEIHEAWIARKPLRVLQIANTIGE